MRRLSVSASLCTGCKILCGEPGAPPNSEASKTMSCPLTLGSTLGLLQPGMGVVQLGWLDSLEQTLSLDQSCSYPCTMVPSTQCRVQTAPSLSPSASPAPSLPLNLGLLQALMVSVSAEVLASFSRSAWIPELLLPEVGLDWFALVPEPPGTLLPAVPRRLYREAEVGRCLPGEPQGQIVWFLLPVGVPVESTGHRPSWVVRSAACGIAEGWDENILAGELGVFLCPQLFASPVFWIGGCQRLSWSSESKSKALKTREVS